MQDKKPLVSIIMNCYNGQRYLKAALDSVRNQSYQNWEIIFWDNCSSDNSSEIAKNFGSDKLKYYKSNTTQSLGHARYNALKVCNGHFISILDSDDIWYQDKLKTQVELMISDDLDFSQTELHIINGKGKIIDLKKNRYTNKNIFRYFLKYWSMHLPALMVKKDFIRKNKITFLKEVYASEETFFGLQLALLGKFGAISEPLSQYRIHNNSLSTKLIQRIPIDLEFTFEKFCEKYPDDYKKHMEYFTPLKAKINYYKARALIDSNGNLNQARKLLFQYKNLNVSYLILYFSTYFPIFVWNLIHSDFLRYFHDKRIKK